MDIDFLVIMFVSTVSLVVSVGTIPIRHARRRRAPRSGRGPCACGCPATPDATLSTPTLPDERLHAARGRHESTPRRAERAPASAAEAPGGRPAGRASGPSHVPPVPTREPALASVRRLAASARNEGLVKVLAYRASGPRWAATYLCGRLSVRTGRYLLDRAQRLELARGLPGAHSAAANRRLWDAWDWSEGGEEWTPSPEWKQAFIDHVILRHTQVGAVTLEIGPGGGRWSEVLQRSSSRLILVDVSPAAIAACQERMHSATNVEYHVTDGSSLSMIADDAVDFVFSFDTFVHVAPTDARRYVAEIARVLRPGGRAVIHHAGEGGTEGGWRSNMTASLFAGFVADNGLRLCEQLDRWGPEASFHLPDRGDIVTVFARPVV